MRSYFFQYRSYLIKAETPAPRHDQNSRPNSRCLAEESELSGLFISRDFLAMIVRERIYTSRRQSVWSIYRSMLFGIESFLEQTTADLEETRQYDEYEYADFPIESLRHTDRKHRQSQNAQYG
jgi:hypothetical protein